MTMTYPMAEGFESALYMLNVWGTAVFAVAGAMTAREKDYDLFGVLVVSLITANGGGTVRAVLLGQLPVFWIQEPLWLYLAVIPGTIGYFTDHFLTGPRVEKVIIYLDALGIATFGITGAEAAMSVTNSPLVVVCMGVATGCFGGVIRDILCGREPLIFSGTIYATTIIAGVSTYLLLLFAGMAEWQAGLLGMFCTLGLRCLGLRYGLTLRPGLPPRSL